MNVTVNKQRDEIIARARITLSQEYTNCRNRGLRVGASSLTDSANAAQSDGNEHGSADKLERIGPLVPVQESPIA